MGSVYCSQCCLFKCIGSVPRLGVNPSSADDLLCGPGQFTEQLRDAFVRLSNGTINSNIHRHVERVMSISRTLRTVLVVAQ